ncbi:Lethal(2)neighbour of Tid protein [Mytilinidion resinicola]|uniref:Dol-P-Man:Man(5)GlcNAc(2)-PP-Dol alpha-1,3-mannosyltransferase n=1 Tax=Mytilinidion resinicola TaxID=574789 RepID=A0A6A6YHD9_9PEZI|nr:Lethal(2)neighbour of Tid protein [Mytilinidion resinicola]KAF2808232.1 Lethal(2)neighbour of Tid protein [Mytilinidion resinicola]
MNIINQALDLASNPKHARWLSPLLLVVDAVLCGLIIWKIPYTEIDWTTYMQHIELYLKGERDYRKIEGSTGPLVYPAVHVYIYRALYALTNHGTDIQLAQIIFGLVYLVTLAVVMACYRMAKAPPYIFPLLILSKRLHSIFILRCFNDCFAVLGLFLAIFAYQRRWWYAGSLLYTTALGVKMTVLLPLPAIGIVLLQALGTTPAVTQAFVMFQGAVAYGYPFLHYHTPSYLARAFEFTRQFMYKWTVNWKFVDEETFLSRPFALSLLAAHAGLLALFAITRWTKPSQRPFKEFLSLIWNEPIDQNTIGRRVSPRFIMTTILTANIIGMLCARSLHYQFYAYIAWVTPFLLWRAGLHPILQYALWGAQEWAWNVYPSTPASSMTVVGVLAVTVAGAWWGTRNDFEDIMTNGGTRPQHEHVE